MMEFLDTSIFGNSLRLWLFSFLTAGVILIFWVLLRSGLGKKEEETGEGGEQNEVIQFAQTVISKIKWYFILAVSIYLGSLVLTLPQDLEGFLLQVVYVILLIQIGIIGNWIISRWAQKTFKEKKETDAAQATAIGVMRISLISLMWGILILAALGNFGFNITTLIAGLGVGGIAVALAAQKILGDLFASATIILDKPFVVGDFIIVGDVMGNVENIGLKTTRIRSLSGEQLILPNSDLLENRIRNFRRMQKRRVVMTLGVVYQTPAEKLKQIPGMLREIVESQENVEFNRSHFKEYGPHSLNFETVYHVLSREYDIFMDIQQAVNLAVYERFEEAGIEFAYPTQTLFVENSDKTVQSD